MAREYFKCFHNYFEKTKSLTDAEVGRLFRALMKFSATGEAPSLAGRESIAFDFIADEIARDVARYDEICKTNAINGAKRTVANGSERQRDEAKPSEIDKVEGIRNKDLKETLPYGSAKKTGGAVFTPPTVDEVRAYCLERKNSVDPAAFVDFYTSKGWLIGKNRMKDWRAAVRTWERERTETRKRSRQRSQTFDNYDEHRDAGSVKPVVLDLSELDQDKIEAMF